MKINHTKTFEINIAEALDELEKEIRKYPDLIGLDEDELDAIDTPIFWKHFWETLLEHARDVYDCEEEETELSFEDTVAPRAEVGPQMLTLDEFANRFYGLSK